MGEGLSLDQLQHRLARQRGKSCSLREEVTWEAEKGTTGGYLFSGTGCRQSQVKDAPTGPFLLREGARDGRNQRVGKKLIPQQPDKVAKKKKNWSD